MRILAFLSILAGVSAYDYTWPGERVVLGGSMTAAEYGHYLNYLRALMNVEQLARAYCATHRDHYFYDLLEVTWQCPAPMRRYPPGTDDGGKWACQLEMMAPGSIVYSIGSEGNYIFEKEMSELGFKVHTFDCYGEYGGNAPPGVRFHKWCTGGADRAPFYKLSTIMRMLGHERIDFLKMDIEGGEFVSLPVLTELPKEKRPRQIAVEIHAFGSGPRSAGIRDTAWLKKTINLMLQLHDLGYKLTTREDNYLAPCCSEFVYVLQE
jgi:hypothetical protein